MAIGWHSVPDVFGNGRAATMTIESFNLTTAHLYGDALASQFRLRHRVFIERVDYKVPTWKGMEFDQFDTPATQYFVWRDDEGEVRGVARLAPTSLDYMLEKIWPEKIVNIDLPHSDKVWEATRFGVDSDLPAKVRNTIVKELICAFLEYGTMHGIEHILGLTYVTLIRNIFLRNGWDAKMVSPVWREDGIEVQAGLLPVSMEVLRNVRRRTQMGSVLHVDGVDLRQDTPLKAA